MKLTAIIQARMGSSRLPGKVLRPLLDEPVLAHVVRRVSAAESVESVIVATSILPIDDAIEEWSRANQIEVFRGSETDVLDRFLGAARRHQTSILARITADCPMHDPKIIDRVAALYFDGEFDYVSNVNPPTFPDGIDVEVFSLDALERSWRETNDSADREHVTRYIRRNPDKFRIGNVTQATDMSQRRWTLDTESDFEFITNIFETIGSRDFGMNDVLNLENDHVILEAGMH